MNLCEWATEPPIQSVTKSRSRKSTNFFLRLWWKLGISVCESFYQKSFRFGWVVFMNNCFNAVQHESNAKSRFFQSRQKFWRLWWKLGISVCECFYKILVESSSWTTALTPFSTNPKQKVGFPKSSKFLEIMAKSWNKCLRKFLSKKF